MVSFKKSAFHKFILLLFSTVLLLSSLLFLAGCLSTDEKDTEFTLLDINYQYDEVNDITRISCQCEIENNTIYDVNGFSITVNLYNNNLLLGTETYEYAVFVEPDDFEYVNFVFHFDGNVTYISWSDKHAIYEEETNFDLILKYIKYFFYF